MTHCAAPWVRRKDDGRPVRDGPLKTNDPVRYARLYAGQLGTHVDLVSELGQIECVSRIGIDRLRRVAEHAQLNAASRTAMRGKLIVTSVAALSSNDITHQGDRRAVGHEIESRAGVIRAKVKLG